MCLHLNHVAPQHKVITKIHMHSMHMHLLKNVILCFFQLIIKILMMNLPRPTDGE